MSRAFTVAAAAAALLAAPAAFAQMKIYGVMDVSAGQFQNAGDAKLKRVESGKMTTSYIGFNGTEDLGGGLKAKFQIESFLRADDGNSGRFNGDVMWARSAWVGLQGGFGQVTLGRNTNQLFVSTLVFNAMGDSFGFSPAIRQFLTPNTGKGMTAWAGDTGWSNSVLYSSPSFGGLTVNLQAAAGEGAIPGKKFGGNIMYFGGPLAATVAIQRVEDPSAGQEKQDSLMTGISYDFKVAKVFAQYGTSEIKPLGDETKYYGLGVSVPVGASSKVMAQFGNSKADRAVALDRTNKTLTLAYDYNLSKSTDIYAVYMNDKITGYEKGNSLAAGIRLRY